MANPTIPGIHHITAICSDPQRNLDFYAGFLGLRLVKKTVNFDDPHTYHLYYGDALGTPGTIMTFFAWVLPPTVTARGRQGLGQVTATPFRVSRNSLDFWIDRLITADIRFDGPYDRFDEQFISFADDDGLPLEIVARGDERGHSIQGFAGATFALSGYERTAQLLTETMQFQHVGSEGSRFRFQAGNAMIDLHCQPEGEAGRMGIGAVHHIAWRTPNVDAQHEWRKVLTAAGMDVTPILDRNYFHSIYYREPGGVLFEIATDEPGFTVDESPDALGHELKLPQWLEPRRERLLARLPELKQPSAHL